MPVNVHPPYDGGGSRASRPGTRGWYKFRWDGLERARSMHDERARRIQENIDGNIGEGLSTNTEAMRSSGDMTNTGPGQSFVSYVLGRTASGVVGLVAPKSREYFRLVPRETPDVSKQEIHEGKEWLQKVQDKIYEVLEETNFHDRLPTLCRELAAFGTAVMSVAPDDEKVVSFTTYPFGSFCIAEGNSGRVEVCFYKRMMTTYQIIEEYIRPRPGADPEEDDNWMILPTAVRKDWKANRLETQHAIITGFLPNDEYDIPESTIKGGKVKKRKGGLPKSGYEMQPPMARPVIDEDDETTWPVKEVRFFDNASGSSDPNALLRVRFHRYMPMFAPRWELPTDGPYGVGPGWRSLSEILRLRQLLYTAEMTMQYQIAPPMQGPASAKNRPEELRFGPGSVVFHADDMVNGGGMFTPVWEPRTNLRDIKDFIIETRDVISKMFFNDLFDIVSRATEAGGNKTATQIMLTDRERVVLLEGVGQLMVRDLFAPLVEYMVWRLVDTGEVEQPPEVLSNIPYDIRFSNIIDVARRQHERRGITDFINFSSQFAGTQFDDISMAIDVKAAGIRLAEAFDVPVAVRKSPSDYESDIDAKRKAQEEQLRMQKEAMAAQVGKENATAANQQADAAKKAEEAEGG